MTFLIVAVAVWQWRPRQGRVGSNFAKASSNHLSASLRYARHSHGMKVVLFRNVLFSLVISIIPALLPVIALKELQLSAAQLGFVFTCLAIGSLVGAVFALPYLRANTSQNAITSISMMIMVCVLLDAGVPAPATQLDGLCIPRGRGLVAGWIRALGRRTARHTGMGAWPDERFPDHARTGRDRDWRADMGFGV